MAEKLYTPEVIEEIPFPNETSQLIGKASSSPKGETYSPVVSKSSTVRAQKIATQLLSTSLNTRSRKILQEFELQQSGGFKIGNYKEGETGEVAITPNGLTAKDVQGLVTFALDALTGDAVFKGIIQAGALISGAVQVGDQNILIDGATKRIIAYDNAGNITFLLDGDTGNATFAGTIGSGTINGELEVGENNILIDGANKRIIINDGTNDRILIGYQSGGF